MARRRVFGEGGEESDEEEEWRDEAEAAADFCGTRETLPSMGSETGFGGPVGEVEGEEDASARSRFVARYSHLNSADSLLKESWQSAAGACEPVRRHRAASPPSWPFSSDFPLFQTRSSPLPEPEFWG